MVRRKWKWGSAIALVFVAGCGLKLPFQHRPSHQIKTSSGQTITITYSGYTPPADLTSIPPMPTSVAIDYRTLPSIQMSDGQENDFVRQSTKDAKAAYLERAIQGYPVARIRYFREYVPNYGLPEQFKLPLAKERIDYLRSGKLNKISTSDALSQLGMLQGVEEARQFLRTYAGDKKQLADNRRDALRSLGYFLGTGGGERKRTSPNAQELALFRAFLRSPNEEDKLCAVNAIIPAEMQELTDDLMKLYRREKSEKVRAEILDTFGWIDEIRAFDLVLSQSYSKSPVIKNAAITSLSLFTYPIERLSAMQRKQIRARLERFTDNHYVRYDVKNGLERLAKAERGEK